MDDMISRQAAINALIRKRQPVNNGDGTITITMMTDDVIRDVLNELPSAQPEHLVKESDNLVNGLVNDCISRQTAIDSVCEVCENCEYFYNEKLIQTIKGLPSAQPRWIPVTEALPEDIRPVIVTWKNNDPESYYQNIVGKHFIGVAHFKGGKWYWYSSTTEDFLAEYGRYDGEEFDEAIEVVAWCELPEPYKEGQNG